MMMANSTSPPTPSESVEASRHDVGRTSGDLDWWNVNVEPHHWVDQCPEYLLDTNEKDMGIISTRDEDFQRISWDESIRLIQSGRIGEFRRTPIDLRRYRRFVYELKQKYGSVLYYMQHVRLDWPTIDPTPDAQFTNEADYKILFNDWPYGMEAGIAHIVVWTKFQIEEDAATGNPTAAAQQYLESFVVRTFCRPDEGEGRLKNRGVMRRQDLIWFKNWQSLRSVHALEHFHILLHNAPQDFLVRVTNGDKPMCEQVTFDD